jgi:hypothetical protein
MAFDFIKVTQSNDIKNFHELPFRIYAGNKYWRPTLRSEVENIFNPAKNIFFEQGECERYLVYDGKDVVARFAMMNNREKDILYDPKMGGIGFIEMENDQNLTNAIIDFAKDWHLKRGYHAMRGPINFGENDTYWGLLVENYEDPPVYGMFYHHPYYKKLIETTGAEKFEDHYSFDRDLYAPFPDKIERISERLLERDYVQFRELNKKNLMKDAEYIRQIYNQAWRDQDIAEREGEFTELSVETVQKMAKDLKPVLLDGSSYLTFVNGEPASFIVTLADINELLVNTHGRIRLWHIPKLLRFKKTVTRIRIIAYGTVPKFRKLGLEALVFYKGVQGVRDNNPSLKRLEGAWISEKNWLMQRSVEALGCSHHKTHRTYQWLF